MVRERTAFYDIWPGNGAGLYFQPGAGTWRAQRDHFYVSPVSRLGVKASTSRRMLEVRGSQKEHTWRCNFQPRRI